jgi:hypothetical protein
LLEVDLSLAGRLRTLAATLRELERLRELDPEDDRAMGIVRGQMEELLELPGGADALVAAYASDPRPAVVRPLAFVLAVAVNSREGALAYVEPTLAMIEAIQTPDPWPRLNLCTAVQRLLIFNAVGALGPARAAALERLLRESLASVPAVRCTAATVIADLFYGQRAALPPAARDGLGDALLALVDDPDELTREEAQGLRDHLGAAATSP